MRDMELSRLQCGGDESDGLPSHMLEALFFSMAVYERTRDDVLRNLREQFGPVSPLADYGFDEDGGRQAVFVARSARSGRVVAACRGTAGLRDVMQDLKYVQSRLPFVRGEARAAAHWGFAERALGVPIELFARLLAAGEELVFVGHSLGGAVASLLSLRVLEEAGHARQVHCITFGCPLFAGAPLADFINANYKDVFTHIVSRRDVVPRIVPFVSTLQRLVYANEDHLEGLLVLRRALELLPGLPLAALLARIERGIPALLKFVLRKLMQLAWTSPAGGMAGSYGFAGHVVMLDADAGLGPALVLACPVDMNVWHSQLGFAFGQGFHVAMIAEHMLQSYHEGILRALGRSGSPSAASDPLKQQPSLLIRFTPPPESAGGEIEIRCDLTNGGTSVEQRNPGEDSLPSELKPALALTTSAGERRCKLLSEPRLLRSLSSAGEATVFRSLDLTARCRACCHKVARQPLGFGRVLGIIGRVARHLRLLDNLCYLTFIRIVVASFVG